MKKYERVEVLMLPKEKREAESMALAVYGSRRYLSTFIRDAVVRHIECVKASHSISKYRAAQS